MLTRLDKEKTVNKKFTNAIITLFLTLYFAQVTQGELVAYWTMDDGKGDSVLDHSGNEHHGKLRNGALWLPEKGRSGGAIESDGKGFIEIVNWKGIPGSNSRSVSAWIKTSSLATIISWGEKRTLGKSWTMGVSDNVNKATGVLRVNIGMQVNVDGSTCVANNMWHHVVAVIEDDGSPSVDEVKLYVDGLPDEVTTDSIQLIDTATEANNVTLGTKTYGRGKSRAFFLLDEVAVFDHALTEMEIAQIYRTNIAYNSSSDFADVKEKIKGVENLLEKNNYQQALTMIEELRVLLGNSGRHHNKGADRKYELFAPDIYFLLANAKESSGVAPKEITEYYKLAAQTNATILKIPRQGAALYWLHKHLSKEEYQNIVQTLIKENVVFFASVVNMSEFVSNNEKKDDAVTFLEANLSAYNECKQNYAFSKITSEDMLPKVYFCLGKVKESAGKPDEEVIEAYLKTFLPSRISYKNERMSVLLWLIEKQYDDEMSKLIKHYAKTPKIIDLNINKKMRKKKIERMEGRVGTSYFLGEFTVSGDEKAFMQTVLDVFTFFESNKDWKNFEYILNLLCEEVQDPDGWMELTSRSIKKNIPEWSTRLAEYRESNTSPRYRYIHDIRLAQNNVTEGRYAQAYDLYEKMLTYCKDEEVRKEVKFDSLECIFLSGKYTEAIPKLDAFIDEYKKSDRLFVIDAMLMKGRSQIQVGEVDKAIDTFSAIMFEYPNSYVTEDVNFFIGYGYLLQNNFNAALLTFESLVEEYAGSPYAKKAKKYMDRIRSMSE